MKARRYLGNPILLPKRENEWESRFVFNPAALYANGLFHLLYRAVGGDGISRMGYGVSKDGYNFLRFDKPVFTPRGRLESKGCEDPRVVNLDNKFYMTYTAYSHEGTRIGLSSTSNFIEWRRYGVILPELPNKDAVLFPEKIKGRYALFHRRMDIKPLSIWIAYSDDLLNWSDHKKVMSPQEGDWDSVAIGAGAPPIKTEKGWMLIYHGVDREGSYSLGVALFDLIDPSLLLFRSKDPILEPEEDYELRGERNQVVFACGVCEFEGRYYIYYGAADKVIGVATLDKDELFQVIR
ncbi:MAG: glycosidase [bacterium]